jgi:hypothetical protein
MKNHFAQRRKGARTAGRKTGKKPKTCFKNFASKYYGILNFLSLSFFACFAAQCGPLDRPLLETDARSSFLIF